MQQNNVPVIMQPLHHRLYNLFLNILQPHTNMLHFMMSRVQQLTPRKRSAVVALRKKTENPSETSADWAAAQNWQSEWLLANAT